MHRRLAQIRQAVGSSSTVQAVTFDAANYETLPADILEIFSKWPQTCELRGPFATSDAQGAKFDFTRFGPLSLEQLAPKLHLTLSFR